MTRLLRNPAYKGDFIAQQYYVNSDRKLVKNEGQKQKYYIEDDHIPIVSRDLWEKAQAALDGISRKAVPTESKPKALNSVNYPYKDLLFCAECGHRLSRAVRSGRVLWECNGKNRFSKDFCSGVSVTDDEVKEWGAITGPIYVSSIVNRGRLEGHTYMPEEEWAKTHEKKTHVAVIPKLTLENYPYKDSIFCKYCGSRLRRIVSNAGKVIWICDNLSRNGKKGCRGIRVPDEKLRPLAKLDGNFFIGKEIVNGVETYGYSRKMDEQNP